MGIYIPNMEKPKDCSYCILANKHINGLCEAKYYCRLEADSCPLIEIVRCGECIYRHEHEWYNTCDKHIGHGFEDEYFCKDGERRTDDNTTKADK